MSKLVFVSNNLELLCESPLNAPERCEIDPLVQLHPSRSHVIINRFETGHLAVIRKSTVQPDDPKTLSETRIFLILRGKAVR